MLPKLLILDDNEEIRSLFSRAFHQEGIAPTTAASFSEAKILMERDHYQGALTDIFLNNEDGLKVMRDLICISPKTKFFSFSGYESITLAVEAIKSGAFNFFPKSLGCFKIVQSIKKHLEISIDSSSKLNINHNKLKLVGRSPSMKHTLSLIHQFKDVNSTVLITGESGTGKEVVARALHQLSIRNKGHFEAINCAALPEALLESELFGHRKGAFTDAKADKVGLFEHCSNGTLLLDEIGDMPLSLQVKLLRVLQEKVVRPLGSNQSIPINPRIIACTHRNLPQRVTEGLFRSDLLFRISVLSIHIPPLRHRSQDIFDLVPFFIDKFNQQFNKNVTSISEDILIHLASCSWPGNIRELQNAIERAVVLSQDGRIHFEHIFCENARMSDPEVKPTTTAAQIQESTAQLNHHQAKASFEKNYISNLLIKTKGNISLASHLSGKHRVEIYRLLKKHRLKRKDFIEKKI